MATELHSRPAQPMHLARSRLTFQQHGELDALLLWLDQPEQQGSYYLASIDMSGTVAWFTDPDTAFAFRIRWG